VFSWGVYSSYKIRKISTISRWEAFLLYCFFCNFFLVFGVLGNFDLYWISVWAIIAWIIGVLLSPRTRRYGCFAEKGYLRSVVVRRKHGRIIHAVDDLSLIDALVVEPIYLTSAGSIDEKTKLLLQEAIIKKVHVVDIDQFLNDEYGFSKIDGHANKLDLRNFYAFDLAKLVIEKAITIVLLFILLPVIMAIAAIVWLLDGRPVFFRQSRLGKGGKPFEIFKFRTLDIVDDDKTSASPIGKFLRGSHLDELPQLWNVLKGDMALLGPRPEWRDLASGNNAPDEYWMRTIIKPGVTGWSQTLYKPSRTRKMRHRKLGHDVYYINNRSFFLDTLIWLRTFQKLFLYLIGKKPLD